MSSRQNSETSNELIQANQEKSFGYFSHKKLKIVLFTIVVVIVIIGSVYVGYRYSKASTKAEKQDFEDAKTTTFGKIRKETSESVSNILDEQTQKQILDFEGNLLYGESKEVVFAVDGTTFGISSLITGDSEVSLELIDPSGNIILPSITKEKDSSIDYFEERTEGVVVLGYEIVNPIKGNWVAHIKTSSLSPSVTVSEYKESIRWSLIISQQSSISFELKKIEGSISEGSPVTIQGVLLDGIAPLQGAKVAVDMRYAHSPLGLKQSVILLDDGEHNDLSAGDGIYGIEWLPPDAGHYSLTAEVTGTLSSGIPYMRQDDAWITVFPKSAHFSGDFSDLAIDEDNDGLYDKLRILVGVILEQDGGYGVMGVISSEDGEEIGSTADIIEGRAGDEFIAELDFDKSYLLKRKSNGPIVLSTIRLEDKSVNLITDEREQAYITKSYNNLDFSGWEARLAGVISDKGVDIDGNGKYNYLKVQIPIEVRRPGIYRVRAALEISDRSRIIMIMAPEVGANISPGVNTFTLRFNGPSINKYVTDGPYKITNISIEGPLGLALDNYMVGETSVYNYLDFDKDTQAPNSYMNRPFDTTSNLFNVSWNASDPSPSIGSPFFYDIQYRVGKDGQWTNWLTETKVTRFPFGNHDPVILEKGQIYYFRSRAKDFAGNQESYRNNDDGDTYVRVK